MGDLILKIFGIGAAGGSGIDSLSFTFLNKGAFFPVIFLGLLLSLFVAYLYIIELDIVSRRMKITLALLRITIILFLLAVFLEPVLVIEQSSYYKPFAVVLVDKSLSMSIKDDAGVRMDFANKIINDRSQAVLRKLEQKYRMKMYLFSNEPVEIDYEKEKKDPVFKLNVDKSGYSTSIGAALRKVLDDLAGQPVAGIILITDGGSNSGEDPKDVAELAGEKGIPVYPVGIGDPGIKKDIAVTNVFSEETAVKGDVVNLAATIENRGYKSLFVSVQVLRKGRVIKEEQVQLSEKNNKAEVNLNFLAEETGENDYSVFIPPQVDEVSDINNKKTVKIKVTDDKLKVLYADGYPRWLYRYLIRSLKRDKGISLSGILETVDPGNFSEGSLPIAGFPKTREHLFGYDVIIIGDIGRNYFNSLQLENIKAFAAEKGGGLFFLPGERWAAPAGRIPELERLFPVGLESGSFASFVPFKIGLESDGKSSPFFMLEDIPAQNDKTWKGLEGVYWALKSAREKPGALIYAKYKNVAAGGNVFAASQRLGNGKVMLFTSDDIWRWRFRNENRYFYRVFGQIIRWLGPEKAASEDKYLKLETDKKKYTAGEKVFVTARITMKEFTGIKDFEVPAFFSGVDGKKEAFTLTCRAKDSALYSGEFTPALGGDFKIWVEHPKLPIEARKVKADISVEIPNMEYEAPELNEELLKSIAEVSKGEYLKCSAASGVADKVIKAKPKVTIKTEKGLKESPFVILLFVLLTGIEWFIRRNKNLM
ncbi:MAG: VWA domain-containing protein [Candidatus Firestonebacteria bacterium]